MRKIEIKKDKEGLYLFIEKWVARPLPNTETKYEKGDKAIVKFDYSRPEISKDADGKQLEQWCLTGMTEDDYRRIDMTTNPLHQKKFLIRLTFSIISLIGVAFLGLTVTGNRFAVLGVILFAIPLYINGLLDGYHECLKKTGVI